MLNDNYNISQNEILDLLYEYQAAKLNNNKWNFKDMIKTYQKKFKNHWAVFNHIIASSILSFPIAMIIGNSQNWPNDAYVYLMIYWIL